jgi:hypothetical protein
VSCHFAKLPKFRAGGMRGTSFHAPAGAFPFKWHAFRNKSVDRVSHVCKPGTTSHFSIGYDIKSQFDLHSENLENRVILNGAKLVEGNTARSIRRASP